MHIDETEAYDILRKYIWMIQLRSKGYDAKELDLMSRLYQSLSMRRKSEILKEFDNYMPKELL